MADVKVRFVGDLGNLRSFDQAISNSAASAKSSFDAANKSLGESVGPLTGSKNSAGLLLQNSRLVVDTLNNTFRQSTDIVRKYLSGYKDTVDKATGLPTRQPIFSEVYVGNISRATGNVAKYLEAVRRVAPAEQQINNIIEQREVLTRSLTEQLGIQKSNLSSVEGKLREIDQAYGPRLSEAQKGADEFSPAAARARQAQIQSEIDAERARTAKGRQIIDPTSVEDYIKGRGALRVSGTRPFSPAELADSEKLLKGLEAQYAEVPGIYSKARVGFETGLKGIQQEFEEARAPIKSAVDSVTNDVTRAEEKLVRVAADTDKQIAAIRSKNKSLFNALPAAIEETRPINSQFAQLLQGSPQLLKALQNQGLGVTSTGQRTQLGTSAFQKTLAQQDVEIKTLVRDITKGETQLRIGYNNLGKGPGLVKSGFQEATISIADNGNVITKWSGILSGTNNLITQFGRNVQRSFGYLVSGALTFGSVGVLFQALQSVNALDANLQRLSITARTTGGETDTLFRDLSRIALETATPLEQVVSAADDIALAVQRAGQSTEQYHQDIVSLTEAVGIFTNLTGTDTVTATDLLSSAFKQLGVGPDQLVGVLSKITAVAGGQSNAIKDISEGVAGIASAAKAGNLNINEMIGTLQVLSQVTAKSPAEVAVAFKNLIGSLASPGSKKILAEYGIQLKDGLGNIRNIIDVYKEISDKAASGVIPEGGLQAVIRGISGGPRRAPDAAALLDNINKVLQETSVAAGATNQALVANARVLDTNTAKVVQFQNALKIAFFEQFGPAIKDVIANLATLGTALLGFTKLLPTGLIASAIQVAALVGGFTLLRKLIGTFALPLLGGLKSDLLSLGGIVTGVGADFQRATAAEAEFRLVGSGTSARYQNTTTGQFVSNAVGAAGAAATSKSRLGFLSPGRIGTIVGLGAIAATAANYVGTSNKDSDSVSQILTLGGTVATFIPQLRLLGTAATIAGVAISAFGQNNQQSSEQVAQNANAAYDAINAYKQAQSDLATANKDESDLLARIRQGESVPKKDRTAEQQSTLIGLYQQYSTASGQVIAANQQIAKSYQDILNLQPQLAEKFKSFESLKLTGSLSSDALNQYQQELSAYLLQQSGQGFVAPSDLFNLVANPPRGFVSPPRETNPQFQDENGGSRVLIKNQSNSTYPYYAGPSFSKIATDQGDQLKIDLEQVFSDNSIWTPTEQNLTIIADAMSRIGDAVPTEEFQKWQQQFQNIAATASTLASISARNSVLEAYIQAGQQVGKFTPEQAQSAVNVIQASQDLLAGAANLPKTGTENLFNTKIGPDYLKASGTVLQGLPSQSNLSQLITTYLNPFDSSGNIKSSLSIPKTVAIDLYKTKLSETKGELQAFNTLSKEAQEIMTASYWAGLGVSVDGLTTATQNLTDAQKEQALAAAHQQEVQSGLNSLAADRAQRSGSLAQRIANGEFVSRPGYLKNLKDQQNSLDTGGVQIFKSLESLPKDKLREVERFYSKIPGFEDAATLSAEQFTSRLITQADNLGFTGTAVDKLVLSVLSLVAQIDNLQSKTVVISVIETLTKITNESSVSGAGAGSTESIPSLTSGAGAGAGTTTIPPTEKPRRPTEATPGGVAVDSTGHVVDPHAPVPSASGNLPSGASNKPKNIPGTPIPSTGNASTDALLKAQYLALGGSGYNINQKPPSAGGGGSKPSLNFSQLELGDVIKQSEAAKLSTPKTDVDAIIKGALALQAQIPGEKERNKDERVAITNGLKVVANTQGISSELLRKSMDNLSDIEKKRLEFDTKADQVRRIRIGSGSFSALANVPFSSSTGLSVGSPTGPISVNLNIAGQVMTPAQFATLADTIAARLKQAIMNS